MVLDHVADFLSHLLWNGISEVLFQDICDAALAGLAVYPDDIGLVFSSHILRIDEQVWHGPCSEDLFLMPLHSLGNSVLMGAGECGEYQFAAVRLSRRTFMSVYFSYSFYDLRHVGEVQLRIHAVCKTGSWPV